MDNGSNGRPRTGNVVIGVMLVLLGVWLMLTRAGVAAWSGNWTLWPFILFGVGLARFLQSPPNGPKEGLLFLTAGAWLFGGEAEWWSLGDSWPILVIAFGLVIALNSGRRSPWHYTDDVVAEAAPIAAAPADSREARRQRRRERRYRRGLSPLAVIGVWIAIAIAIQMSGVRGLGRFEASDRQQIFSVMGNAEHVSPGTRFRGANVTNVMGRSELDLTDATLEPGAQATVNVFSAMGRVVIRVPPTWAVDTRAVSALGAIRDGRSAALREESAAETGARPRLVLRGVVAMGRLEIR